MKIETDHKPLETILSKPLRAAPARLQRMMMSYKDIQSLYNTDQEKSYWLPILFWEHEWMPKQQNQIAWVWYQHSAYLVNYWAKVTKIQRKKLEMTQHYVTWPTTVQNGWPQYISEVLPGASGYWNYRDKVTYHHGIIFKGGWSVPPTKETTLKNLSYPTLHLLGLGKSWCSSYSGGLLLKLYWSRLLTWNQ